MRNWDKKMQISNSGDKYSTGKHKIESTVPYKLQKSLYSCCFSCCFLHNKLFMYFGGMALVSFIYLFLTLVLICFFHLHLNWG